MSCAGIQLTHTSFVCVSGSVGMASCHLSSTPGPGNISSAGLARPVYFCFICHPTHGLGFPLSYMHCIYQRRSSVEPANGYTAYRILPRGTEQLFTSPQSWEQSLLC